MRLYSFIRNENGTLKAQGGQKRLGITLLHETTRGSWQTRTEEINVDFFWQDGKPALSITLPADWSITDQQTDYSGTSRIRAEYQPKEKE